MDIKREVDKSKMIANREKEESLHNAKGRLRTLMKYHNLWEKDFLANTGKWQESC